jgi:cell division protein FtsL
MDILWRSSTFLGLLILFVSCVFLVKLRYLERVTLTKLQQQEKIYQELYSDSTKLLLEYESLVTFKRIDKIAREDLNMRLPSGKEVVLIEHDLKK